MPHHFSGILSIGYRLSRSLRKPSSHLPRLSALLLHPRPPISAQQGTVSNILWHPLGDRGDTPPVTGGDLPPSLAATLSPGPLGITAGPNPEISYPASPPSSPTTPSPTLGHGKRQKKAPSVLKDYVCHTAQVLPPPASSTPTNCSNSPKYPLANFVSCKSFFLVHTQFLDAVSFGSEPRSYKAASHNPKWHAAMRAEIDALEENGSWTIKDLPPGKKPISSKWVYKNKLNSDGSIERYKAQVVVRGDTQVEGLDYT
ncbi:hypothetical protein RJ639_034237 [Escallonia herrerae]|uniref:Reverse transcriptase Ty1/copia-type domain-containing protein n=1 Tax=Escallonia herrerae TaxID=1293975 RepID=A0AA88WV78_9ASTE|nr:hypothetical protein RJ639_034237 [Escallonia herrerae]